jgi:hypothetical protein
MDIGVTDAVEVREHRHPGIVLHPGDEALAAARHDHVDQPRRAQHRADRLAVLRRHQLDRLGGTPAATSPSTSAAWIARFECTASLPPRSSTALPLRRHSAAASAVTLGRLS